MARTSLVDTYEHLQQTLKYGDWLKSILPQPEEIETDDMGRLATSRIMPEYHLRDYYYGNHMEGISEFMRHEWWSMYKNLTLHVAKMMIGRDHYYVLKFTPEMKRRTDHQTGLSTIRLILWCDINIAQTREMVIAEWVYTPVKWGEKPKVVEWRCGYCQKANPVEHRECEKCGAPRTLLLHELQ